MRWRRKQATKNHARHKNGSSLIKTDSLQRLEGLKHLFQQGLELKHGGDPESWQKIATKLHQYDRSNIFFACEYAETLAANNSAEAGIKLLESIEDKIQTKEEEKYLMHAKAKLSHAKGNLNAAEKLYRQITKNNSDNAEAWRDLSTFLEQTGRITEAENAIKKAYQNDETDPGINQSYINLLIRNKKAKKAREVALKIDINKLNDKQTESIIQTLINLQLNECALNACTAKGFFEKPELRYRYAAAQSVLANGDINRYAEIISSMNNYILPGDVISNTEAVYAWLQCGQATKANQKLGESIKSTFYDPRLYYIKAQNLLRNSDYLEGWKQHEHRLVFGKALHHHIQPNWTGTIPTNQPIIIIGEQGAGDMIFFSRFIPDLLKISSDVTLLCEEKIGRFLSQQLQGIKITSDPKIAIHQGRKVERIAIGSIPLLLQAHHLLNKKKAQSFKFKSREADKRMWKKWLAQQQSHPNMATVGLSLEGGRSGDHLATIPRRIQADYIFRNADPEKLQFVNIQYKSNFSELQDAALKYGHTLIDASPACQDLTQLAACLEALSFSITSQQTNAHLSGTLQLNNIVLLPPNCHFVFGSKSSDWYPSLELIRSEQAGEWEDVENQIHTSINKSLARSER